MHQIMPEAQTHPPVNHVLPDHHAILEAMEAGDADHLLRLVRDHIQDSADRMMGAFRLAIE